ARVRVRKQACVSIARQTSRFFRGNFNVNKKCPPFEEDLASVLSDSFQPPKFPAAKKSRSRGKKRKKRR
ncbi:MAG: hypothetical protein MK135_17870, partial [Polyangiaceae bacterium]|nr:hypothetical protein [Polyangiaceae bacterium]